MSHRIITSIDRQIERLYRSLSICRVVQENRITVLSIAQDWENSGRKI